MYIFTRKKIPIFFFFLNIWSDLENCLLAKRLLSGPTITNKDRWEYALEYRQYTLIINNSFDNICGFCTMYTLTTTAFLSLNIFSATLSTTLYCMCCARAYLEIKQGRCNSGILGAKIIIPKRRRLPPRLQTCNLGFGKGLILLQSHMAAWLPTAQMLLMNEWICFSAPIE